MLHTKTFLIMAGGTGGHIYPALATARELQSQGDQVHWLGASGGMEQSIIEETDIPFHGITISGVRGGSISRKLMAPFKIGMAVWQALKIARKVRPNCSLGMGGFASGPGGAASFLLRIPLVVHEQNAVAGMTNKILSKVAKRVLEAFPNSFGSGVETKLVGNPLRKEICEIYYRPGEVQPLNRRIKMLILGGSLGAAALNEAVPKALSLLDKELVPEVIHQSGKRNFESAKGSYKEAGVDAEVKPYIEDMAEAYKWADIVVCRSGALTISELCTVGLGAILVPYPHAVDDHQTLNAKYMVDAGAAWIVPQSQLSGESLAEILTPLLQKTDRIAQLAESARKLAKPESASLVASECRSVCYG